MPIQDLKEQIARLPEQPGVYLWMNRAGDTIYVGKARALRDRVRSYLAAVGMSPRHDALLDEIASVEVIVTIASNGSAGKRTRSAFSTIDLANSSSLGGVEVCARNRSGAHNSSIAVKHDARRSARTIPRFAR